MTEPHFFRYHVFCCTNERPEGHPRGSCKTRGAEALRDHMKARCRALGIKGVRVNQAGCLDRCELGPTLVIYPEGIWYKATTVTEIDQIIDQHLVGGAPVDALRLGNKQ